MILLKAQKNSEGSKLYDLAFAFIGLNDEREYFGLRIDDKLKVRDNLSLTTRVALGRSNEAYP